MKRLAVGTDRAAQAVAIAGELAERGITSLTLEYLDRSEELLSRVTDLPAVLIAAPIGTRLIGTTLEVRVESDGLWITDRS